jgi:hypothetical protein
MTAAIAPVAMALAVAACGYLDRDLQPGSYRAALETPAGQLPFGLDVAKESDRYVLYLINGEERLRVEDVQIDGGNLRATLPGSAAAFSLRVKRKGLEGELSLPLGDGKLTTLPLRAELGKTHLFFEEPLTDNADVQGRWSVVVSRDALESSPAVAVFHQQFERVRGRILTREAEGPMLVGEIRDEELYLSRFDGSSAVLLHAKVDARGALEGEMWSAAAGAARVQAVRNPDAAL